MSRATAGPRSGKMRSAFDGQGSAADTKNAWPCVWRCVRYDRYGVTPCHVTPCHVTLNRAVIEAPGRRKSTANDNARSRRLAGVYGGKGVYIGMQFLRLHKLDLI